MYMIKIQIKREKQSNGLWGMPLNCYSMDKFLNLDDRKMLLFSALVTAIDEKYNSRFKIRFSSEESFVVYVEDNYKTKTYQIIYDDYEIEDNIVYGFENKKEHLLFLRNKKLKKLENVE